MPLRAADSRLMAVIASPAQPSGRIHFDSGLWSKTPHAALLC
jgi:hypothetical protein